MKNRLLFTALITQIVWLPAASAQNVGTFQWPPLPKFTLSPRDAWLKNKLFKKDGTSYYDFTEKLLGFLHSSRLYHAPGLKEYESQMGESAFAVLSPQDATRLFLLAPERSNQNGATYGLLDFKRVTKFHKNFSQVLYVAEDTVAFFHAPLFSPNGKKVIIRDGYPPDDRYNGNKLFLWELGAGKLHFILPAAADVPRNVPRGNDSIMLPYLSWSPGSRYLSYMRGGNTFGDYDSRSEPYELYCMDSTTRLDHRVMQNAGLHWSWTYHGQLLCSLVKPENQGRLAERSGRPSVYAVNAQGGQPKKLFDGGTYAQESPDGKWIAFCDWPGDLFDATNPSDALQKQKEKGLFLFYKPLKKRIFVGALQLEDAGWPADAPLLQWSPDGRQLYVLDSTRDQGQVKGMVYRMEMEQQQLEPLSQLSFVPQAGYGYFRDRGISPDGQTLYYEWREGVNGPSSQINQKFTLIGVSSRTGAQTPLASLMNIASENPDWDFHDESGINPALAQAEKRENALFSAGLTPPSLSRRKKVNSK